MVALKDNEIQLVVNALRKDATDKQHKRAKRWKLAMIANAIERRAS